MRIEFLGTGGASTTPRPLCDCRVCVEARTKGVPYSRSGPSVFVHGPDLLIDTPEEIKSQLNRSQVRRVAAVTYSHWHPDHTAGRRVLEEMNIDWRAWPGRRARRPRSTCPRRSRWTSASGSASLRQGERRALIAPDELNGWSPPEDVRGVDVAVLPMGIAEFHPLTGDRLIHEDHRMLQLEATFDETLEIVERLDAGRVYLTHVEEMDQLSHDELGEVGDRLRRAGLPVEFAYDTLVVEV